MRGTILSGLLLAVTTSLGGCYATGDVGYRATYSSGGTYSNGDGSVYVSSPDLVTISPGVQVVADYDEPVFYTDGFYWRYYNNGWYRSNNYAAGWSYYARPPVAVLRIDRPHAYAHYRPRGYVVRRDRARYRPSQPIVYRSNSSRPEPVVRERVERRDDRRDERIERRDDRRDERIERRDDRRDNRSERRDDRRDRRR